MPDTESKPRRHFLNDVAIYGVAGVLAQSLSFLLVPLYTNFLTTVDYGVLDLINQIGRIVTMALMLNGISMAAMTYFLQAESELEKKETVASLIAMIGCAVAIGMLLMIPISLIVTNQFDLPYPSWLILLGGITVLAETTTVVPYVLMQARIESKRFLFWNIGTLIVRLSATILVVAFLGWGVVGILAVRSVVGLTVGTILLLGEWRQSNAKVNWSILKSILKYSLPFMPFAVLAFVRDGSQRFFLLASDGPAELGLYALGATLCFAVKSLAITPLHKVWCAKMYEVFERPNGGRTIGKVATGFVAVHTAVGLPLILFSSEILDVISSDRFLGAEVVIIPLFIAGVIETFTTIPDQVFFVRHRTGIKPFIALGTALVAIVVFALMVPNYGIIGAAWGLVIVMTFRAVVTVTISRWIYPIHFELTKLILIVVMTSLAILIGISCPSNVVGIFIRIMVLLGWATIAYLFELVPHAELKNAFGMVKRQFSRLFARDLNSSDK